MCYFGGQVGEEPGSGKRDTDRCSLWGNNQKQQEAELGSLWPEKELGVQLSSWVVSHATQALGKVGALSGFRRIFVFCGLGSSDP